MVRNTLGSLLGLIGAAAAVRSPFRPWYGERLGRTYGLAELFGGKGISSPSGTELLSGLFLPMLVAAVVVVLAVVLRSRLLMALAGVVALGFTVLWMVREGQALGVLTAGDHGLGPGVAGAASGAAVMWVGALVMRGRRPPPPRRREPVHFPPPAYRDERYYPPPPPAPHGEPHGEPQGAHDAARPFVPREEPRGPERPVRWPGMQRLQEQQDAQHRDDEAGHTQEFAPVRDPDAERTQAFPGRPPEDPDRRD